VKGGTAVDIRSTHTEEIVFALCGPIGSPLHDVAALLADLMKQEFAYTCKVIRLSQLIEEHTSKAPTAGAFDRVKQLIKSGNDLRQRFGASILADLAIREIASSRELNKEGNSFRSQRVCHIIDSVKNQEELETLRVVYRDMLYCIGVFAPLDVRVLQLQTQMSLPQVYELVDQDSGEEMLHGQTVRDTFPKADYFLRSDGDRRSLQKRLDRLLDLVFGTSVVTPSADETAMYHAASASRNSACLSRQVGAAITDTTGKILGIGWNDVPQARGGLYRGSPEMDGRCAHWHAKCHNAEEKDALTKQIVDALVKGELLKPEDSDRATKVVSAPVGRLIEFSRAVHAELHAIISAAQSAGNQMLGGMLYCTTYPCHACARHIVAAGLAVVRYIEPYRKSLALKLHSDALTENEGETSKVRILPYDGVAPARYLELFDISFGSRKNGCDATQRARRDARPKCEVTLESIPALEGLVVKRLSVQKVLAT
jgi:deoxycytidylate deaminase